MDDMSNMKMTPDMMKTMKKKMAEAKDLPTPQDSGMMDKKGPPTSTGTPTGFESAAPADFTDLEAFMKPKKKMAGMMTPGVK